MAENANDLQDQAAGNVAGSERSKNDFGIFPDYGDEEAEKHDGERGLAAGPGHIFEAVVADGAGHKRAENSGEEKPCHGPALVVDGRLESVDEGGDDASGGGRGESNKIFRATGGHALHVKSREAPGATDQESEAANPAELADLLDGESVLAGQAAHAPGVGHESRCDAETDYVGEGIELHAKFRARASHARDAAVERIEQDGKTYGFGGAVELVEAAHQ